MKQNMKAYTAEDLKVWKTLFERQDVNLTDKVCGEYQNAIKNMSDVLNANEIPDFKKVNEWFKSSTEWQIEVVPGLIPVDEFFVLLAEKKFCSSTWLRTMKQLDYLEEPDMFHDTFGHIPLLSDPIFSKFMQRFGEIGVRNLDNFDFLQQLQRLYWYTIEFGMIDINNPKIYGAGIISSFGETNRSISKKINKIVFDMDEILMKTFKTDEVQNEYVCIDSFENLFDSIINLDKINLCQLG